MEEVVSHMREMLILIPFIVVCHQNSLHYCAFLHVVRVRGRTDAQWGRIQLVQTLSAYIVKGVPIILRKMSGTVDWCVGIIIA